MNGLHIFNNNQSEDRYHTSQEEDLGSLYKKHFELLFSLK